MDAVKHVADKIGTPAARHDRADPVAELGCGHKSRRFPGAGTEQAEWEAVKRRGPSEPPHDINEPLCQKCNIEDVGAIAFFLRSQQVEPCWFNASATATLRGVKRLEPLPCANTTSA